MNIFKDKIVIVTGAASGIGRALCEELSRRGAKLVMADRNQSLLEEAASAIKNSRGSAKAVPLDVTDFQAVKKMVDDAVAEHGRLDYIFNNAGMIVFAEARFFEYSDWTNVINTNLFGVVNGVAAAYPVMVKQGFGHIINTASAAGVWPMPGCVSYTASKYGIVGLSHALRIEAEALGVKVSVVCPGFIETPIYEISKMTRIDRAKFKSAFPKAIRSSAEKCSLEILRGVEKNKATIITTGFARTFAFLHRMSPGLVRKLLTTSMIRLRQMKNEK